MNDNNGSSVPETTGLDFIRKIIAEDIASGKHKEIITRFPPEPNGYLHIGHSKAITLSFSVAQEYGGYTNLRFDDTNPAKEEVEYIESIKEDVRWLGFEWKNLYHASDYFETLYDWAVSLIEAGYAYVCDLTAEQMREMRGTLTEPGVDSPFRTRSVEENLALFKEMRAGKFPDGSKTLRAKVDMAHPNLNMRDPVMYRILHKEHPHRGTDWCIYPTYDWTHGQSDSIENITHSLCTLEFEAHRPLYDWFIDRLVELKGIHKPRQIEFARLDLTYTVMSKRKLLHLVKSGLVHGWDDPRMPTLRGLRRRGVPPEAIRLFIKRVGVAKANSKVDLAQLEHAIREVLNVNSPRRMAVLDPLKVTITNYPMDEEETLEAINNPEQPEAGSRKVPFSRELYIEREDFMEDPPKKFFRLAPGREVRLRYAYFITCNEVVKDEAGNVVELKCTYDPETRGGDAPDGRKVKGTLHWVSAKHAVDAEVRMYEPLFSVEDPDDAPEGGEWTDNLNPDSEQIVKGIKCEPSLAEESDGFTCQFERKGYFTVDKDSDSVIASESSDSGSNLAVEGRKLVFNRTATLRDSWAKMQTK